MGKRANLESRANAGMIPEDLMTCRNACGFLAVGLSMLCLPRLAPELVVAQTAFVTNSRALWLLVMGILNAGLGVEELAWHAAKRARFSVPAWVSAPLPAPVPLQPPLPASVRIVAS